MGLSRGTRLGPYEVLGLIGAGGMGEVYRARDTRLGRNVAVKVLSSDACARPDRAARFEREARAIAALDDPGILAVHDVGTHDGIPYLVTELLEGESLRARLGWGAVTTRKALEVALEVAHGLAAAHSRGIVHCDIKPENLFVTRSGRIKILDFGLATLRETPPSVPAEVNLSEPTASQAWIGTLGYASPEQVRGAPTDHRTDLFSLGAVLYEMLAGRAPFRRETPADTISATLRQDPPPLVRSDDLILPGLESVVRRCLEKNADDRFQSAHDLALALQALSGTGDGRQLPPRRVRRSTLLPLVVLGLGIGAAAVLVTRRAPPGTAPPSPKEAPAITSLAVLPLIELSRDPSQEYFADGMTEAITASLGRIGSLKVISRTSAMTYKAARKPLPQIAEELGVDGIVEGSILRSGDRTRVMVRLVEAATDRQRWAGTFDRDVTDILSLHDDVARAIAAEVRLQVAPRGVGLRKIDPTAYDAYLKGRSFMYSRVTPPGLERSIGYFQQAIARDPRFAEAHAGLAEAYGLLAQMASLPLADIGPKMRRAALAALEIDDTLGEAHASLGNVKRSVDWDWEGAERELERAIELRPSFAMGYLWHSQVLNLTGRHEEAYRQILRARELDPMNPFIAANVVWRLYFLRRYDEALAESRKLVEAGSNLWLNHWVRGFVYSAQGMYDRAVIEHRKAVGYSEGALECLPDLGYSLAKAGRTAEARRVLQRLESEARRRYVPAYYFAIVYEGLGDRERAIAGMEKAYAEHDERLPWLAFDPLGDSLRPDPRYRELLNRLNLPGLPRGTRAAGQAREPR